MVETMQSPSILGCLAETTGLRDKDKGRRGAISRWRVGRGLHRARPGREPDRKGWRFPLPRMGARADPSAVNMLAPWARQSVKSCRWQWWWR